MAVPFVGRIAPGPSTVPTHCNSAPECERRLSALDPSVRAQLTWVHVQPAPFEWWFIGDRGSDARFGGCRSVLQAKYADWLLREAGLVFSLAYHYHGEVNVSYTDEQQARLVRDARTVLAHERAIVIAQSDRFAQIVRPLGARVAAPEQAVFDAFESATSGKRGTAKWLHQHGLGRFAVKEYNLDWLLSPAGAAAFPVVLKPVVGFGGRGVQIVRSVAALRQALHGRDPSEYILQEAITSPDEWGVYFVAHGGELLHAVCKRFAFNDSLFVRSGGIFGEGLQEQGVRPCDASPFGEDPLRNLVARARYHGFGTLGLKARAVGEPAALIEMNARVGYSMMVMLPALLEQVQRFAAATMQGQSAAGANAEGRTARGGGGGGGRRLGLVTHSPPGS